MSLQIRPVDTSTQEKAKELILQGLEEHFGLIDPTLNSDLDEIVVNYIQKGHIFLIGCDKEGLVCTGALVREDQTAGRIVRMSVRSDRRRRGYGKKMLEKLESAAIQRGMETLILETNKDWTGSIHFYQSIGFIPYHTDDTRIHMKKNLCLRDGVDHNAY
ncbi:GNAT family N-acetyltransferase [Paenactinomyces guangxiensis]|uniref:GNAT family N-acetyltransferase n=1 Tax=Paenactinomyces guangxiensis TaxID=1490290 RepID=A0A7W2A9Z8_9BACL|nr:GNAT family N-acetyltransferase [Paenactinomyces guangxiensis]MBA4495408.1 GNAT family N-acetyltransferase [Paenactinomyces guangxiensis]MBH8592471.1 GNAT family N-acetyltransferase [Paenactinomyces guangxiensis]